MYNIKHRQARNCQYVCTHITKCEEILWESIRSAEATTSPNRSSDVEPCAARAPFLALWRHLAFTYNTENVTPIIPSLATCVRIHTVLFYSAMRLLLAWFSMSRLPLIVFQCYSQWNKQGGERYQRGWGGGPAAGWYWIGKECSGCKFLGCCCGSLMCLPVREARTTSKSS